MANLAKYSSTLWDLEVFYVFDDFTADQSDLFWIDTVSDAGTVLMGDNENGIATLTPSDVTVTDNDEVYLASPNAVFLVKANRSMYARTRISFVETAAGIYNAAFGFASAVAADLIVDNGGGPRASGTIIVIEKRDGETAWRLTSRQGSAVTTTLSNNTSTMTTGVFQVLEVEAVDAGDGINVKVSGKVDNDYLRDPITNQPIKHNMLIASSAAMQLFVGAKLGAITNNDLLLCDLLYGHQTR